MLTRGRQIVALAVISWAADSMSARGQETASPDPSAGNGAPSRAAPDVGASSRTEFDFTQKAGEHPLAPTIRVMNSVLAHIDQNIRDYSCTLYKQERIDGELGEPQHIFLKVRHQPFSVYMNFLQPFRGREVLYVAGKNNGKLVALDSGFKRKLGPFELDPQGMLAMKGQKYPITKIGIRNLVSELLAVAQRETRYGECEVSTNTNTMIDGRPATLVQVTHPVPRREFSAHVSRVFLDHELGLPIHYDSHMWPDQEGGQPVLEESYTYRNLQINIGLDESYFDKENPEIFRP
jgi:hypothetical protein